MCGGILLVRILRSVFMSMLVIEMSLQCSLLFCPYQASLANFAELAWKSFFPFSFLEWFEEH